MSNRVASQVSSALSRSCCWIARCQSELPVIPIRLGSVAHYLSGRAAPSEASTHGHRQSDLISWRARAGAECTAKPCNVRCCREGSCLLCSRVTAYWKSSAHNIQRSSSSAHRNLHPECFPSQHSYLPGSARVSLDGRFISSQVKTRPPEDVEAPPSTDQESQSRAFQKSLLDFAENDAFLQEARRAGLGLGTIAGTQAKTGREVEDLEETAQTEDSDEAERLEKAQQDYLEALGKGDVADLDLDQLETVIGEDSENANEFDIGILYLKLGQQYDEERESAEKIFRCGEKAFQIFQNKADEDVTLEVAMALHLKGIGYVGMQQYEESLPTLEKSFALFYTRKDDEGSRMAKCAVQLLLGEALSGLGKSEEALVHLRSAIEEEELLLGENHAQLGRSYRKIAEVLTGLLRHEEAVAFIEKALTIDMKAFGEGSMEEAIDRRLLAVNYIGLCEHEKALAQHFIVRTILSKCVGGSQTVFIDVSVADTEIALGKYDDAFSSLQTAMAKVEHGSAMHCLVLVNLAKIGERLGKPVIVGEYAKQAIEILENEKLIKSDPLAVAEGFTELATLYEKINKIERAIELHRKAHAIYAPIPTQRNALAGTQAQIGMLFFFVGKVEEALPFLEQAAQNLQDGVGEQNIALAMVLNHIGVANMELERIEVAVENFERAKFMCDDILGADHVDTIAIARNLVGAYSLLDRPDDALRYQEEVITYLTNKGDEAKPELQAAVKHLQMLQQQKEDSKPEHEMFRTGAPEYGRVIID